jgi:hypothetical protein
MHAQVIDPSLKERITQLDARVNKVCSEGVLVDVSAAEQMVHELQVGVLCLPVC